jgi:hypothetical protein
MINVAAKEEANESRLPSSLNSPHNITEILLKVPLNTKSPNHMCSTIYRIPQKQYALQAKNQ